MAGHKRTQGDRPSIKHRSGTLDGAFFELADFDLKDYAPNPSNDSTQSSEKLESRTPERLSTAEFISAVGHLWSYANSSLAGFHDKSNLRHRETSISGYQDEIGKDAALDTCKVQCFPPNLMTVSDSAPKVHNLESLKVTQKLSTFESCRGKYNHSLFGRILEGGSNMPNGIWKGTPPVSVGISYDLGNIYGWMSEKTQDGLKHRVGSTQTVKRDRDEGLIFQDKCNSLSCCLPDDTVSYVNDSTVGSDNRHTESINCVDSSSYPKMNTGATTSLSSDYFLGCMQDSEANGSVSVTLNSRLHEDYHISASASDKGVLEDCKHKTEHSFLHENKRNQHNECVSEDESKMEMFSSTRDKPRHAFAKQEHAFAGALAGVFVSLCLHPVDTVKTVIQSCPADQKSISYICKSIISERGVGGLYRGIASNIASSAPISAVYTFTYESVKGALLPLIPKECHSFAHCVAGGCASIATSFIFTPSERIKQQLQVGSHYQNCWTALVGIIERGGFSSLYAGWGAVLCRNVPHSVIKFYTYESLKQVLLSSTGPNAQPNTLQTLVCGGLAGSTAALFTTPFDVVKTRLQTQIPGSMIRYDGVLNTLKEIGKHEGLRGLYRGLTPRLVMYMTQGALFFASYETFKKLYSLDAPQRNEQVKVIHGEEKLEGKSTLSLSSPSASHSSSALPSSSTLRGLQS